MGSDDLFKKRKAKQAKDLKRKQTKRAYYYRVLIVCEGETEPYYFQVLYRNEQRTGIPFDRVYCVFDKDTHESYERALQVVENSKPKDTFFAINSVPCFEYWLLLHYVFTTQPFYGIDGGKSARDQVLVELKKYISDYAKGDQGYFENLIDQLPQAIQYSKRALESARGNSTDNPTTMVYELVEYLQELSHSVP